MTDPAKGSPEEKMMLAHTVDLLTHYSFDLGTETAHQHLNRWLKQYQSGWIRWAVIEALYQGRYKAISVEQILQLWQRRQQPCYHFSYEFERLVCNKFPRDLVGARSYSSVSNTPAKLVIPPRTAPPSTDPAILPALPVPSRSSAAPTTSEPPAWAELADQIHQDIQHGLPIPHEVTQPAQPTLSEALEALGDPAEVLSERVARLQAGVEALIEQATSSLNASTEAVKTRLRTEEELQPEPLPSSESPASHAATEELHPPIHQFTPVADSSDFHSKLKAVVEQEVKE